MGGLEKNMNNKGTRGLNSMLGIEYLAEGAISDNGGSGGVCVCLCPPSPKFLALSSVLRAGHVCKKGCFFMSNSLCHCHFIDQPQIFGLNGYFFLLLSTHICL